MIFEIQFIDVRGAESGKILGIIDLPWKVLNIYIEDQVGMLEKLERDI